MASIQKPEPPLFKAIRVLVPGTGSGFRCGGLSVALQTARLLGSLRPTSVVTYRQRNSENPYLFDLLESELPSKEILWLISWGFDIPFLLRVLREGVLSTKPIVVVMGLIFHPVFQLLPSVVILWVTGVVERPVILFF